MVVPRKRCELGSWSQKLDPEPSILTLKTKYSHNTSLDHLRGYQKWHQTTGTESHGSLTDLSWNQAQALLWVLQEHEPKALWQIFHEIELRHFFEFCKSMNQKGSLTDLSWIGAQALLWVLQEHEPKALWFCIFVPKTRTGGSLVLKFQKHDNWGLISKLNPCTTVVWTQKYIIIRNAEKISKKLFCLKRKKNCEGFFFLNFIIIEYAFFLSWNL